MVLSCNVPNNNVSVSSLWLLIQMKRKTGLYMRASEVGWEETCILVGIYLGSDLGIHPKLPCEVRLENSSLWTLVPHVLNSS